MIAGKILAQIAGRLMRQPAAPYFEHGVRAEAERICDENGLRWNRDEFGNTIVRLKQGRVSVRPLVLAAHMDHPGFEIVRGKRKGTWNVRFQGGVPEKFFRKGLRVRLMPGASQATLTRRVGKERRFEFKTRRPLATKPVFAVWDLQDFAVRNGRIHGRACDDLIGVAAILNVLLELKRSGANANVIGFISRAEEIGLRGALAAIGSGSLPRNALIISLETSRELPSVKMGQGVILRVGDKTSVFDTRAMRFLHQICEELRDHDQAFRFQRALMSGGTCEATAFQEFGYQTGAVCIALGNYHNCADKNRIAEEYIDLQDARSMAQLLIASARAMPRFDKLVSKLPGRLERLMKEARVKLRRTADINTKY